MSQDNESQVEQQYNYSSPAVQYRGYTYSIKGESEKGRFHYCIVIDGREKCSPQWVTSEPLAKTLAETAIDEIHNSKVIQMSDHRWKEVTVAPDEDW